MISKPAPNAGTHQTPVETLSEYRAIFQARKKSTKIKFLGPETARWGGGLPREGVVAENFVPALETLSSLGFEERNPGCPGNFAGMSRTPEIVQKVCAKKLRAHFSFPKLGTFSLENSSVSVHSLHFMVCAPLS